MKAVTHLRDRFGVDPILRVLGVAPSTYYGWLDRQRHPSDRQKGDAMVLTEIAVIHDRSGGTYGSPRVHATLRRRGVRVSEVPAGAQMMFVPQQAYLPQGSLRALASYPSAPGRFTDEQISEALRLFGLGHLEPSLDAAQPWDQVLSGSEQQLLAFARVLLNRPEWVFLDKSTSELDEALEERVYGLLAQRLPHTTVVSVAQRPSVLRFHARHWTLTPRDHGASTLQPA